MSSTQRQCPARPWRCIIVDKKIWFINVCIFFFLLFASDCSGKFIQILNQKCRRDGLKVEAKILQGRKVVFLFSVVVVIPPPPLFHPRNHVWSISSYNSRRHRLCALDDLIKLKAYFTIGYNPNEILMIQPWSQHIIICIQTWNTAANITGKNHYFDYIPANALPWSQTKASGFPLPASALFRLLHFLPKLQQNKIKNKKKGCGRVNESSQQFHKLLSYMD